MPILDVETLLAHEAFVRRITRALVHRDGGQAAAKFAAVRMLVDGMDAREQADVGAGDKSRPARVWLLKTWAGQQLGPIVVELGDAADDVRPPAVPAHRLDRCRWGTTG